MNKFVLFVLSALVTLSTLDAFAGQYTRLISGRVKVLSAAGARGGAQWATNTSYAQGTVVTNNSAIVFFAVSGGTSDVTGVGPRGLGETNDATVVWMATLRDTRRSWIIQNVVGGEITVQIDSTSTSNRDGIVRIAGSGISQDGVDVINNGFGAVLHPASVWQGDIFVVTTGATITATEW